MLHPLRPAPAAVSCPVTDSVAPVAALVALPALLTPPSLGAVQHVDLMNIHHIKYVILSN